jgi:lysozyme family protein
METAMEGDFQKAIEFCLRWEGGHHTDPDDPGGETNFGISKRQYPDLDIGALTRDQAITIYHQDYWVKGHCPEMRLPLNWVHFDCCVNAGIHQAAILLQRSLYVDEDGLIGPHTLQAMNEKDPDVLAILCIAEREHYYRTLAQSKPVFAKQLNGWLNRCESLKTAIHG